jgi:hypothetical protein
MVRWRCHARQEREARHPAHRDPFRGSGESEAVNPFTRFRRPVPLPRSANRFAASDIGEESRVPVGPARCCIPATLSYPS